MRIGPPWWTAESRLAALKVVGGDSVELAYDAAGRLVRKKLIGAAARFFLWQGDNLLAEIDSLAGKVAEYSYYPGLDHPHAVITATTPHYAHVDGIGNVIALTDSAKNVKRDYDFDAWGACAAEPTPSRSPMPIGHGSRGRCGSGRRSTCTSCARAGMSRSLEGS